ncbi:MAG TPA: hypothetical protein VFR05_02290 [Terriglobia bacterium]|nr:hypothetical protein [Terriglobia bacterium]
MPGKLNLDNIFTYHAPHGNQAERYVEIREKAKELAKLIQEKTPESREQSVALTNVQQAVMWANAAIAINENDILGNS